MSNIAFLPINAQQLQSKLTTITPHDLMGITLVNADILIGGIFKLWEWDGETLLLSYNTSEGKRFGDSCLIYIPLGLIADVSVIPLAETSTPTLDENDPQVQFLKEMGYEIDRRLCPQDYPNPFATIIFEHNALIASQHSLEVSGYMEKALSQDAIPPTGIHFNNDFLLYADWPFFSTQSRGNTSISVAAIPGLVNLNKNLKLSPEQEVLQILKATWAAKLSARVSPTTGTYQLLHGCLLVPDPAQTSIIEGKACFLYKIAENQPETSVYPVLLKSEEVKFPIELIHKISSNLTFYGELLPIPISIIGEEYKNILLARAIGYLSEKD